MKTIYLDIDGVINAMSHNPPRQNTGWTGEWKQEKINGYVILWSVELVEWLNRMAAREDVTIKWLTTWQDEAGSIFSAPTGLDGIDWPYFMVNNENDLRDMINWWKLDKIRDDLELRKPEKAVWIDDDWRFDGNARNWVTDTDHEILAVSPNSNHGLTKKDTVRIEEFLSD